MKRLFIVFILFFSLSLAKGQDREAILKILHEQTLSWNAGNLEQFMGGYLKTDSLMFVGKKGITYGWNNVLQNYKTNYPGKAAMGTLTFSIKKVELLSPDVAFVVGQFHLKREKDEPTGHFTLIFKRFKEGWKIVSDHSS
jgi:ketosteroid isomerase-like protein